MDAAPAADRVRPAAAAVSGGIDSRVASGAAGVGGDEHPGLDEQAVEPANLAAEIPSLRRPATAAEIKALSHPLRIRILRLCQLGELTNKATGACSGT